MFIRAVDESLERWLRAALPMPTQVGDIGFDQPSSSWSAKLSRITVNLFLYDVALSTAVSRAPMQRMDPNGRVDRRPAQPMIRLSYLASAWAGSPRDEHQLLGELVSLFTGSPFLPAEHLSPEAKSSVQLTLGDDEHNRLREIWGALGGQLKASFSMTATVAADTFDWEQAPPPVERVVALSAPMPRDAS